MAGGHAQGADQCLLLGAKRTSLRSILMSANDPKRTLIAVTDGDPAS
jgi:hypothetical protein